MLYQHILHVLQKRQIKLLPFSSLRNKNIKFKYEILNTYFSDSGIIEEIIIKPSEYPSYYLYEFQVELNDFFKEILAPFKCVGIDYDDESKLLTLMIRG